MRMIGVAVLALLGLTGQALACAFDEDCSVGQVCVNMSCYGVDECEGGNCPTDPPEAYCLSPSDCPEGMVCEMGACPDCMPGLECPPCDPLGRCVPGDIPPPPPFDCYGDGDCPADMFCVLAPCPACRPGEECPPCAPEGHCVAEGGTPDEGCGSDADCPEGLACEQVILPCAAEPSCPPCACADCLPGQDCPPCDCPSCDPIVPEPCEPLSYGQCVLPDCVDDGDCAEGFECAEVVACYSCDCTGCACPPCLPGEECPPCDCPDDPPTCDCPDPACVVMGATCRPLPVPCSTDDDCDEGWECLANGGDCACPACDCYDVDCAPGVACDQPYCECPPCDCGETESYCIPVGWDRGGWESDEPALNPAPSAEPSVDDINEGENGDADQTTDIPQGGVSDTESGSCSLASGSQGELPALMTLLLLGALALLRRRG